MINEKRYLIITADERTWKFDRPVIFLGEWCRNYHRKHIWQHMDAIVAAPYGLGLAKKDIDHARARSLEDRLFPILCDALNQHHGLWHSERFWRIILGHWLRRYVDVILNRFNTLEQCLQENEISGATVLVNEHYALATPDSHSAILAFNDEHWNNALTARVLNLLSVKNFPIEIIAACSLKDLYFKSSFTPPNLKISILEWVYQKVGKLASYLVKDTDALIISSYLPIKEAIKLQLALGQCPQLWTSPKVAVVENPDRALRKSLAEKVAIKSGDKLENNLFEMVFELLPVCYLEGFANVNKFVKKKTWPKCPKFILTSNNFDTDEAFKLWTATKVETGFKYFVGQHGNSYGTYRYVHPTPEEMTADKFLTWGWTDGLPQHTCSFIIKTAGRKADKYNPQGDLLLIEDHLPNHFWTWDVHAEFMNYFKDQQNFILKLNNGPKLRVIVRLHAVSRYMNWGEEAKWKVINQKLKIDIGNVPIRRLIAQSRLVVYSYDSTGILELLSQNIPILAFWQNNLDHLRESAKPHYQLLVDSGIVHFTPESLALKVNEVWDDVEGWWKQSEVQNARQQFCDRYARVSKNPMRELEHILLRQMDGIG